VGADIRGHCFSMRRLEINGFGTVGAFARAMSISPTNSRAPYSEKLVTVVVPAYNAARTIDETLRSARAQTHRNLEILVVDDGSRDQTAAGGRPPAALVNRIRLIAQPNAGVAAARNLGIAEARIDLIAPLDADDLWDSHQDRQATAALARGGEKTALVYTWYAIIDEGGNVRRLDHSLMMRAKWCEECAAAILLETAARRLFGNPRFWRLAATIPACRSAHAQGCEDMLFVFPDWPSGMNLPWFANI